MYRHEAIGIARKVMASACITTELPPWVVDAILSAVNGTVTPDEVVAPVAWAVIAEDGLIAHLVSGSTAPRKGEYQDEGMVWQPLYLAPQPFVKEAVEKSLAHGSPTPDETPIPALFPVSAEPPDDVFVPHLDWTCELQPETLTASVTLPLAAPPLPNPCGYIRRSEDGSYGFYFDKHFSDAIPIEVQRERTPVAWRRKSERQYMMSVWTYWPLETAPNDDHGHEWQPLYA